MKDLIAKLEAAMGPSRELDAEIACAVRFPALRPARAEDHKEHQRGYPPSIGDIWCPTGFLMADSYTSSLDAAMTLVPERHDWSIFCDNGEAIAGCQPASEDGCDITDCHGATPAIALCIAALRARDGGNG